MSDEIFFDGRRYISASEAAASSDLTRDYVARLCRDGKVAGRRVGKNWYIDHASFQDFLITQQFAKDGTDEILFDGRRYISASEAAASSDLTRDYVARLCRDGKVAGRRVGKNWYVEFSSLKNFLITQEYAKSARSEALARERAREYYGEDVTPAPAPQIHIRTKGETVKSPIAPERQASMPAGRPIAGLISSRADEIKNKLAAAVAAQSHGGGQAKLLFSAPGGFAHAALSAAHVPVYSLSPLTELLHKITALALALMLTFGTYAAVDPSYARFAADSIRENLQAAAGSYRELGELAGKAQSDIATAAENPQAALASAATALTEDLPSAAMRLSARLARALNTSINSALYAIAFPLDLVGSRESTGTGTLAVEVAPYTNAAKSGIRAEPSTVRPPVRFGTQTIVNNYTTIERAVPAAVVAAGGITEDILNKKLAELDAKLSSRLVSSSAAQTTNVTNVYAAAASVGRIEHLDELDLTKPTITNGTITGTSITNAGSLSVSGNTALSTTTVTGDLTVSGAVTFTGTPFSATNVTFVNGTTTNSTSTNLYSSSLVAGNATSTNLFASLARFTSAIMDALTSYGEISAPSFSATSTSATSTFSGGLLATRAPTLAHTFSPWTIGAANSNLFNASLVVNPASAAGDSNLIAAAVDGSVKFLVDAEGDVFVNNLTSVGSVTLSTTSASTFNVEGNTTLGDSITDVTTVNGSLIVTGTTTASTIQGNFGIGTTTPWARLSIAGSSGGTSPLFTISTSTAGYATSTALLINANGNVGIGTTSPSARLAVASPIYVGGTGVAATSTFEGNMQVYGLLKVGTSSSYISDSDISTIGNLTVTGATALTGLLSLSNASTSQLSVFNRAYFGGTATSTFDSAGALTLVNALTYGGVTLNNAVTGTGNMVLSASPTLTGTLTAAAANFSGNTTLANATSTNLFSSTASSTNLFAQSAQFGALTLLNGATFNSLATFANGFLSQASSTIGNGTQAGGLTISGGATTTGNAYFAGTLGVGATSNVASALVQLDSTTKGFLPPRLTTAQKNAIASPASGLTVFDTDLNKLNVWNGSIWKNVGSTEIGGEVTSGTTNSVLFVDAGSTGPVLAQDNASFNYASSTHTLTLNKLSLTAGTTTNFFSTTASSTNLFSQNGTIGVLTSGSLTLSSALPIASGGTNATSFGTTNGVVYFDGTRFVNAAGLLFDGTKLTATYASSTALTATNLYATSASTTGLIVSGVPNALPYTTATGQLAAATVSSATGVTFAAGTLSLASIPNSSLTNSTISGIALGSNLADLTATNGTLTFSGAYNGSTARTVGLNLGQANSWSALQQFTNASSSLFSVYQKAYFGATATTTIDSAGNLSVAGTLGVTGGTTLANATSTNLFSTTASSTNLFSQAASVGTLAASGASTFASTLGVSGLSTFAGFISSASSTITSGLFSMNGGASTTNLTVSGTAYFGGNLTPTSDNTSLLGTSTLRFKEGNFGPSGVNVWNVGGTSNYEQGSLAFSSNVLKLLTAAPVGGNYRDIQIAPGNSSGLYVSAGGPVGLGYTSLDTSYGNSLLVNGRIGVGTTTPGGPLVVLANGRATGDLRYGLQIVNTDFANTKATNIAFAGGGGTAAASGNWYVGTDAVHDNSSNFFIATSTGASAYKQFVFNGEGTFTIGDTSAPATPTNKLYSIGGALYWNSVALNGSVVNYWTRSGTSVLLNTNTDNVGIGATSTPGARLAVAGAAGGTTPLLMISSSTAAFATSTVFQIASNGTATLTGALLPGGTITNNLAGYDLGATGSRWNAAWVGALNVGTSTFSLKSDANSNLGIFTAASGGGTQAMTVTSAGNVGIGTTSPSGILELGDSSTGALRQYVTNSNSGTGAFAEINVRNAYNVQTDALRLVTLGTGFTTSGAFIQDAAAVLSGTGLSGGLTLGTQAAAPLSLYTNNSERMRIDSSGNVGIGTTTPGTYGNKLTVTGVAATEGSGGGFFAYDRSGTGGSNVFAMYRSANVGQLYMTEFGNIMSFSTAGNVGIGTTSPTVKLNVVGGVAFQNVGGYPTSGYGIELSPNSAAGVDSIQSYNRDSSAWRQLRIEAGTLVLNYGSGGNVGIGTASPTATYKLDVNGSTMVRDATGGNSPAPNLTLADGSARALYLIRGSPDGSTGNFEIIYMSTSTGAEVNRTIYSRATSNWTFPGCVVASNVTCPSDFRLKQNITPLSYGLAEVMKLKPVSFEFNDTAVSGGLAKSTTTPQIGFIAQEMQPVVPEAVFQMSGADGYLGINYALLTSVLTKAVQEVNGKVDSILNGTATSTITNVAYTNASTTATDTLCIGGDCRTAWPEMATSTIDLSAYATTDTVNSWKLAVGSEFNAALGSYVSTSSLAQVLADYANKSDPLSYISPAAITAQLDAVTSSLASAVSGLQATVNGQLNNATSSLWADFQTTLAGIATTTVTNITNNITYATTTTADLSGLVSTSTLTTTLGSYVTFADLPSPITLANLSGTVTGNILPASHNTYDLGTNNNRFANIYAQNIHAGDLTFTETTSAVSGNPLSVGDMTMLYVTQTGANTHTVPVNLNTAINANPWNANNIFFNTSGSFAIGIASTTAPRGKLDVEGSIASGDSRFLTLANTSGANGNAAIPYSFYIPSTTGDLNLASNDNGNGSLVNTSYSAWNLKLGGQSDAYSISRSPSGTQAYSTFLKLGNGGSLLVGTSTPSTASALYVTATSSQSGSNSLLTVASTTGSALFTVSGNGLGTLAGGFLSQASSTVTGGLFTANGGASTTNITASGIGYFGNGAFTATTGTTTIASGQGFTIGSSQFVLQQGSGNVGIGTTAIGDVLPSGFNSDSGHARILEVRSTIGGSGGDAGLFLSRPDGTTTGLQIWHDFSQGDSYFDNRYNNDAGNIRFRTKTAGTPVDALTILGSGNVGIGKTAPQTALDVVGTASSTNQVLNGTLTFGQRANVGTGPGISYSTGNALLFGAGSSGFQWNNNAGNAALATMDNSGNLGIGTATNLDKLTVNGAVKVVGQIGTITASSGLLDFSGGSTRILSFGADTSTRGSFTFYQGASDGSLAQIPLFISTAGNVGIGTTSPMSRLAVVGTGEGSSAITDSGSKAATLLISSAAGGAGDGGQIEFGAGAGSYTQPYFAGIKSILGSGSNNTYGDLAFFTRNAATDSSLTERIRILGTGNVGIGTTTPGNKLTIQGDDPLALQGSTGYSDIFFKDSTSTLRFLMGLRPDLAGAFNYTFHSYGGNWSFDTGNVGIGTVSPNQKFQVVGNGIFGASSMDPTAYSNGLSITGATNAATGLFLWKNGQASAQIGFRSAADQNLYILNSYTTGLISNSPGIAIDTSGNVGIGDTTPTEARLTVNAAGSTFAANFNGNTGSIVYPSQDSGLYIGNNMSGGSAEFNIWNSTNPGTYTNTGIRFMQQTGAASYRDLMFLKQDGSVGIGTTSPASKLDIGVANDSASEAGTLRLGIANSTNSEFYTVGRRNTDGYLIFKGYQSNINGFRFNTNISGTQTDVMSILSSGNVGIGETAPGYKLEVNGTVRLNNLTNASGVGTVCVQSGYPISWVGSNTCVPSDERLKTDIVDLSGQLGLAAIGKLHPVQFDWKDAKTQAALGPQVGLLAQDVQKVVPELVTTNGTSTITLADGTTQVIPNVMSVSYDRLSVLLIKAVQEQQAEFDAIVGSTTASTTPQAQNFASTFFSNLFARVTQWLASATNGIGDVFAKAFHAKEQICVDDQCLNKDDIRALIALARGQTASAATTVVDTQSNPTGQTSTSTTTTSASTTPAADTEAPTLTLHGENPATIQTGMTYADQGATATDNHDTVLYIYAQVDQGPTIQPGDMITLDTTQAGDHTVTFTVTDEAGNTSTATRTVHVVMPEPAPAPVQDTATTTTP